MEPYRQPPRDASQARLPASAVKRHSWWLYALLAACGPFGWLALAAIGTPRGKANDVLAALPFPVSHDRPAATDETAWRVPLETVTIQLQSAPDGIEADRIARAAEAAAPGISARVDGTAITLGARARRGDHLVMLADLLATWGVALHQAHGIAGVRVAWRPRTGPSPLF